MIKKSKLSLFSILVLYIHIIDKKKKKTWTEFKIELRGSFKNHQKVSFSRGNATLLVRNKYVQCKCPHLRPGKSYLLLGRFSKQMKFVYKKLKNKKSKKSPKSMQKPYDAV